MLIDSIGGMVYTEKEFLDGLVLEGWKISGDLGSVLELRKSAPGTLLRARARIENGDIFYTTASVLVGGDKILFRPYESPNKYRAVRDFYLRVKRLADAYMYGDTNVPKYLEVFFAHAIPPIDRWPSSVPAQLLTGRTLHKANLNLAEKHQV